MADEALLAREDGGGITVFVRPELVVEIALDGVQADALPGGVALRFARVKGVPPGQGSLPRRTDRPLQALVRAEGTR